MPLDDVAGHDPFARHNGPDSPIMFPVVERRLLWETKYGGYERVQTHKAIIRMAPSGDGALMLNVVGTNYKVVHNKELFTHVEDIMRKEMRGSALDDVEIKDSVAGFGRTCYRQYIFPNIRCRLPKAAKSDIAFRLIVQNGYGGSALRMHAGAIEFFCTNGMITGAHESTYRKHTSGLIVEGIGNALKTALATFTTEQDKWIRWATKPVQHAQAMELFRELATSEKLRENLSTQYMRESDERGPNLWAVYSAMTYYASHSEDEFKLRATVVDQDTVASTMLQRELNVAKWVNSVAWHKLENA